ncbi:ATP-binding protein [Acanthopleuribacter pedis]|uniref:ATP-binding protein n=1 Tax=Acanthopleuribacter pedis TaxID=442870 RepID=A0A8J7QC25_9BACT|nr:ATP-binding protein [Acanthopleuribacter pedis]MBO1321354.1 ATP-binding protein [Acanthopleuribacter pedis]
MSARTTLEISNEFEAIRGMSEAVEAFCREQGMDQHGLMSLNLALVEWVSNIIKYSGLPHGSHHIQLEISREDNAIVTTICDPGVAFNPSDTPEPDLESDIKDRPIGGLGIYIIRNLVDQFSYQRTGERNQITMRKQLRSAEPEENATNPAP